MNHRTFPLTEMKHSITFLLILFAGLACSRSDDGAREFKIRNISISEFGNRLPEAFPPFLVPPGARVILSGIHDSETALSLPEGAARMETQAPSAETAVFYYDAFRRNGWNIIQSLDEPEKKLIMAESRFGRLLTVLLYGKDKTSIKIYIKQLGGN